jgi:hypothetical protein
LRHNKGFVGMHKLWSKMTGWTLVGHWLETDALQVLWAGFLSWLALDFSYLSTPDFITLLKFATCIHHLLSCLVSSHISLYTCMFLNSRPLVVAYFDLYKRQLCCASQTCSCFQSFVSQLIQVAALAVVHPLSVRSGFSLCGYCAVW